MSDRRLVGVDLGIASAHTVRVLDGHGNVVAKRRAWPTVESLTEIERAALAGTAEGTRLEVVMEPTGPAWLPIAVFFTGRGHVVHRVSSAKSHDLRKFLSRHTKTNGIDADTLARIPLFDPDRRAAVGARERGPRRVGSSGPGNGSPHPGRRGSQTPDQGPDPTSDANDTVDRGDLAVRSRGAGALRRPERPAQAGRETPREDHRESISEQARQRPRRRMDHRSGVVARVVSGPSSGRVRRDRRRDRDRGPPAASSRDRTSPTRRRSRRPLHGRRPRPARSEHPRVLDHRRPGARGVHGRPGPLRERQTVPILQRPDPESVRDRQHRPQRTSDVQSRIVAAAHHTDPRCGPRPPTRPPARPDLLHPDGRTRQEPPRSALRRRRQPRRTRLDRDDTGTLPTSSATSTAHRSPTTKPPRSSPTTGPFPPRSEPDDAAPKLPRRGRPPRQSQRDNRSHTPTARTHGATSPDQHHQPHTRLESRPSPKAPLDTEIRIGNQNIGSKQAPRLREIGTYAGDQVREIGTSGRTGADPSAIGTYAGDQVREVGS